MKTSPICWLFFPGSIRGESSLLLWCPWCGRSAAAARKVGIQCAVMLSRDRYQEFQGNLLTVYLMGAQVHLVESSDHWDLERQALDLCETLRSQGHIPHYIPVSGTTPHSCLGYVRSGLEIIGQVGEQGLRVDAIYVPFGTGGIFTGILLALRAKGITCPVIGISVNRKREQCFESQEKWWFVTFHELWQKSSFSAARS